MRFHTKRFSQRAPQLRSLGRGSQGPFSTKAPRLLPHDLWCQNLGWERYTPAWLLELGWSTVLPEGPSTPVVMPSQGDRDAVRPANAMPLTPKPCMERPSAV
jgi:hypothetical protein